MSTERLKQLAIALVVVLSLWGLASAIRGGTDQLNGDFSLPSFDAGQVTGITIAGATDSVVLELGPDGWTVNGFEASASLVNGFLAGLDNDSTTAELASVSEGSHARMEVDDLTGKRVSLVSGSEELGAFTAGKRGNAFGTFYVRMPGAEETYLLRSDLLTHIARGESDWREHQIVAVDPDSIGSVQIARSGRGTVSLTRGDSTWTLGAGLPADSATVARMIERYRSLRATGFASDTDTVQLDRPDMTISLADRNGSPLVSLSFDSVDSGYWVKPSGSNTVFKLAQWSVGQLVPADSLLRAH